MFKFIPLFRLTATHTLPTSFSNQSFSRSLFTTTKIMTDADHEIKDTVPLIDPITGETVSKSELKRRIKQREKDAKKAEKASHLPPPTEKEKDEEKPEEILEPRMYFENRSKLIDSLRGDPATYPYPHKFHVTMSISGMSHPTHIDFRIHCEI